MSFTTIREPWERRTYGSPEAFKAMSAFMKRLKREDIEATRKRLATMKKQLLAGRPR
jgi:hypothetical protein